jgi:hypothetical protein
MRRHRPHDCAAYANLHKRVGALEQRVAALEPLRPRLRLVNGETPTPAGLAPDWPELPHGRLRVDAAHPLLIAVFVPPRDGAVYHRDVEGAAARVLDRVA